MEKINFKKLYYEIFISLLALVSIVLIFLDFNYYIDLNENPYLTIDYVILAIFWVDYIYFYIKSENKKEYFKKNILNLIAIIPLNGLLSLFIFLRVVRLANLFRLTKFIRLIRAFSFLVILKPKINRFLYTNGFIYSLYFTTILIFISSILINIIEKSNFSDSLWWSIVTATTVGYGDISPKTVGGRIIAVVLMLTGIGFISMLTSTITNFFTKKVDKENKQNKDIKEKEEKNILENENNDEQFLKLFNSLNKDKQECIINLMNILKTNSDFDITLNNKKTNKNKRKLKN